MTRNSLHDLPIFNSLHDVQTSLCISFSVVRYRKLLSGSALHNALIANAFTGTDSPINIVLYVYILSCSCFFYFAHPPNETRFDLCMLHDRMGVYFVHTLYYILALFQQSLDSY